MTKLSLSPVSVALYSLLNVAGLTTLATGGVYDDVPQGVAFPFVLFSVSERDIRGLGTGELPEVALRIQVFSTYAGMSEAQGILRKAIELLKDQVLTVSGYASAGRIVYDDTVSLGQEVINGVACHELAANFRLWVEA